MKLSELVTLREINKDVAKEMVEKFHYSHLLGPCSYSLGIFYKKEHDFFYSHEELIGCMTYGVPLGRLSVKSISEKLEAYQSLELTRLFIHDGYEKNIESYSISKSFYWIRKNLPEVEVLLSYSDPEYGHKGTIYQATNWLYQGRGFSIMEKYQLSLTKDPYEWIHHRTIYDLYGSVGVEDLKKTIGRTFWLKTTTNKHRYIYLLRNRKYWLKHLKYPVLPYPKTIDDEEEVIREIIV